MTIIANDKYKKYYHFKKEDVSHTRKIKYIMPRRVNRFTLCHAGLTGLNYATQG